MESCKSKLRKDHLQLLQELVSQELIGSRVLPRGSAGSAGSAANPANPSFSQETAKTEAARKADAEAERRRGGLDEQTKDQMRSEAQMRRRLWDIADAAKEAKRRRRRAEEWSRTAS